ncbi:hypothetical protein SSCG_00978 [Streptomyces clavuligerus]|nr:hypothetical protein SSCG_00978 [Streptomyces clavuligerus]
MARAFRTRTAERLPPRTAGKPRPPENGPPGERARRGTDR